MQSYPVLITGGSRRIGLALARHFLHQHQPVIISYRHTYPDTAVLQALGAICLPCDFSTDEAILAFAETVRGITPGLRAIIHNASAWQSEADATSLSTLLTTMMQVHVHAPYLLNHALAPLLEHDRTGERDIIHITDYVATRGSDKHIAYAASKAALENMTRSFAMKLAPSVKVNTIAPAMIAFNENDPPDYRQRALDKSLMKIAPGAGEMIALVDYLMNSRYVTGARNAIDGGRALR